MEYLWQQIVQCSFPIIKNENLVIIFTQLLSCNGDTILPTMKLSTFTGGPQPSHVFRLRNWLHLQFPIFCKVEIFPLYILSSSRTVIKLYLNCSFSLLKIFMKGQFSFHVLWNYVFLKFDSGFFFDDFSETYIVVRLKNIVNKAVLCSQFSSPSFINAQSSFSTCFVFFKSSFTYPLSSNHFHILKLLRDYIWILISTQNRVTAIDLNILHWEEKQFMQLILF